MSQNTDRDDNQHASTRTLLSWYANGTLDEGEAAAVEAHLAQCADCRRELKLEQALVADLPDPAPGLDVDRGWAAMRTLIETGESAVPAIGTGSQGDALPARGGSVVVLRPRSLFRRPVQLGWAVAAQAAAIALMVGIGHFAYAPGTGPASPESAGQVYHALGSAPETVPGNVLVMFRPDTPEGDLRRILRGNHAELVGGPNASGAYMLRVTPQARDRVLRALGSDPQVTLVQPMGGDGN